MTTTPSVRESAQRTTAVAKTDQSAKSTLRAMIESNKGALEMSLPRGMDGDRFSRLLLTAANTNPELFKCDPLSFLAAGVQCAQLGLEPNDARGLAYLVPFNDKRRGKIVQFMMGYRGMLELTRRSGQVGAVSAHVVYAEDLFEWELGLEPKLVHKPHPDSPEDPKTITHAYAVAGINGERQFIVLTRKAILSAKARSMGASSPFSPWATDFAEMAKKTAIRRLAKYLPMTVEAAAAIDNDDRSLTVTDLGHIQAYADNGDDGGEIIEAIESGE